MSNLTDLAKVQKAIDIQGYVTVNVAGLPRAVRSIKDVSGEWVTDIPTWDEPSEFVRVGKMKPALVAQAEAIIAGARFPPVSINGFPLGPL